MKDNFWSYLFAGIAALSGIVYLYQANQPQAAPVTNVFPPLNTSDPALASGTDDPLPTQDATTTTSPITQKQSRPTYPIYYT